MHINSYRVQTAGIFFAVVLLFILHSCKSANSGFVKFDDYIKSVEAAKAQDYLGKKGVLVKDEKEFEKIKQHILYMYKDVKVENSFVDKEGRYIDCIPIDQQPTLKGAFMRDKKISLESPKIEGADTVIKKTDQKLAPLNNFKSEDIELKEGELDSFGNHVFCKKGYVPMLRISLEQMVHFRTLEDFFKKAGPPQTGEQKPGIGDGHHWAYGYENVDNIGGDSWLNVWNPTVADHNMSLSQHWYSGGTGDNTQTVEGGWQVFPDKYGTDKACLFIFSTSKNYADGSGGYNLEVPGFIQIANNVYLGKTFTNYSSDNGTQWGFRIQWKRANDGNWWLFYKGNADYIAVGYYPQSFYGTGQMSNFATAIKYGGEDSGVPAKEMGSGQAASAGWAHAAFQNTIFYTDKENTNNIGTWANLTKAETHPTCYTSDVVNVSGDWGTYLYFGGASCTN